jgi:hypothetical protein
MSDDRKPIRDGRGPETRNVDDLVMALRDVEGIRRVRSGHKRTVSLTFDLSDLDRETAWEGSDIPPTAAMLLLENRFVPTGFGREHNSAQDEYLPVIRFEAAESVAGRAEGDDG